MGRERAPDPGHRWQSCDCPEIDPADIPCIVCETRFPPDGIDDESAETWKIMSEAEKIVMRGAEREFIATPRGSSKSDAERLIDRHELLEHASVLGSLGVYVWGYRATPRGRRLIDYGKRISAQSRTAGGQHG